MSKGKERRGKRGGTHLGEHRQNIRQRFNKRHTDFIRKLGVPALQVVHHEVVQFTALCPSNPKSSVLHFSQCEIVRKEREGGERTHEFDTGGSTANDDHVQQALNVHLGVRVLEFDYGRFNACPVWESTYDVIVSSSFQPQPRANPSSPDEREERERGSQSITLFRIFSASLSSFMKHECSLTPGILNVCVSAPTAYTR